MGTTRQSVRISLSEGKWRQFFSWPGLRPNVLIACGRDDIEPVVTRISGWCTGPLHARYVPGDLSLTNVAGTLLLWDVARLTDEQQQRLLDWTTDRPTGAQVICISSVPLLPLVEEGLFLEALLYRINTVRLVATVGTDRRTR
jgi:hypothetical protein